MGLTDYCFGPVEDENFDRTYPAMKLHYDEDLVWMLEHMQNEHVAVRMRSVQPPQMGATVEGVHCVVDPANKYGEESENFLHHEKPSPNSAQEVSLDTLKVASQVAELTPQVEVEKAQEPLSPLCAVKEGLSKDEEEAKVEEMPQVEEQEETGAQRPTPEKKQEEKTDEELLDEEIERVANEQIELDRKKEEEVALGLSTPGPYPSKSLGQLRVKTGPF